MPLCSVCKELDLGRQVNTADKSYWLHEDYRLGAYDELVSRAEYGCEACKYFCTILQTSTSWKERQSELAGLIIVFSSLRLDVRRPDKVNGCTWSCDDLLFDLCTPEDYTGELKSTSYITANSPSTESV